MSMGVRLLTSYSALTLPPCMIVGFTGATRSVWINNYGRELTDGQYMLSIYCLASLISRLLEIL